MLPDWARDLSYSNPVLYMVNAFRFGFFGRSDVDMVLAFAIMLGFALVLFAIALWLMRRGIGLRD